MPDGSNDFIPTEKQMKDNPSLVEFLTKEHANDIKSLKQRVTTVEGKLSSHETMHKLTEQTMASLTTSLDGFKADMRESIKDIQNDMKKNNEVNHETQLEHLKSYKNTVWAVGATIVGSGTVGVVLFLLNN